MKQDRSRRCKYIQSNMTFSLFLPFLHKLLIKSTKYYQIRDQRVWISGNRHLTCPISKILFLAAILIFFENAVLHIAGSYRPISLIFNSEHWKTTLYVVLNFEENRSKIATVRVPHWKTYKMAAMTSSILNFQNPWKMSLANILQIICGKFHQNRPIRMGCRDDTHRQTDTQTHRHPRFDPNIFSQNLTEYKNMTNPGRLL